GAGRGEGQSIGAGARGSWRIRFPRTEGDQVSRPVPPSASGLVGQEPAGCVRVLASAGYTGRPRCPPSNTANYPIAVTRASAADLHLVTTPAASAVHRTRVDLAAVPISPVPVNTG